MSGRGGTSVGLVGPAVSARPAGRRGYLVLLAFGAAAASGAISLGAPAEVVLWSAVGFTGVLVTTRLLIGFDSARLGRRPDSTTHRR